MKPPPTKPSRLPLAGGAIILIHILVRLLYWWEISDQPVMTMLMGDAQSYDLWATEIAGGDWIGQAVFFQSPLYPYFLATIYSLCGRSLALVRAVQIGLGALACWCTMRAGEAFCSRRVGLLAGLMLALYPTAIFHDLQIQKACLDLVFIAALLWLCGRLIPSQNLWRWMLPGVVLGCVGLNRENALLLIPGVLLWLWIFFQQAGRRRKLQWSLALLGGTALVLLPVGLRNQWVGGEFLLTTSQFGYNFYVGNSRQATGGYRPLTWEHGDWRSERQDVVELAEKRSGRALTPAEISRHWFDRALEDIRADPAAWLRLMLKKSVLFVNAAELSDTESEYAHRQWSRTLWTLGAGWHFGVLLPMAAAGMLASRHAGRRLVLFYLVLGIYGASVLLFYNFSRYRLPVVPVLAVFAAAGALALADALRQRSWARCGRLAGLVAGVALIANWSVTPIAPMIADTYYNIGCGLEKEARAPQAAEAYRQALRHNPAHIMAMNNLGIVLQATGDVVQAREWFQRALTQNPGIDKLHNNLGVTQALLGNVAEALAHFQAAIRINPDYDPVIYFNLACMSARQGDSREALRWLQTAIARGYRNRAALLQDPDLDAIRTDAEFQRILRAVPGG
jgi:tetratricopeptide (TPR) repeat protein